MKNKHPRKKSEGHSRGAPTRLLETALDAFAKSGFEGASLRGIAEQAGFSFQLITYHFGSKEELWIATVNYLFDQRNQALKAAAEDPYGDLSRNPRKWMRNWLRTGVLFAIEDPRLRQLIIQEFFANSERYRKIIQPKLKEMGAALEASFHNMCASGVISRFSAQEALLLYRCIVAANIIMPYEVELITGLPLSVPTFIEKQVDLLVAMLADGHGVDGPDTQPGRRNRKAAANEVKKTAVTRLLAPDYCSVKRNHSLDDGRLVRGRDARSRLIASAIKIFGTYGFEGTSLRTIAEEAGLAFQLTTYHFGSKEELWTAALTQLFDQRLERVRTQKFDPNGNLDQQILDWIQRTLVNATEEPMLRRIFTQEYFANSDRYQRILKPKIEELMDAVNARYRELTERKIITRFSYREVQLILRSVVAANSIMPYEIELTLGNPPGHRKSINFQVKLLFNLFTEGRGSPS